MGNDLNYKSLYLTNYKKLPIYFFYGTLIFLAIAVIAVIAGIAIFIQNDYFWVLLLTILGGWLISLGIALYVYWMSSVIISQRVVVADTLLAMHKNKESGSSSTKEQNVVFQKTTPQDNTQQDTISQKTITDDNIPKNTIPQKDAVKQSSETDRQKLQEQQKIDAERRKQIEERKALMMSRRNSNLCQHCGGSFKGLFTKTCESCGNPKDY